MGAEADNGERHVEEQFAHAFWALAARHPSAHDGDLDDLTPDLLAALVSGCAMYCARIEGESARLRWLLEFLSSFTFAFSTPDFHDLVENLRRDTAREE